MSKSPMKVEYVSVPAGNRDAYSILIGKNIPVKEQSVNAIMMDGFAYLAANAVRSCQQEMADARGDKRKITLAKNRAKKRVRYLSGVRRSMEVWPRNTTAKNLWERAASSLQIKAPVDYATFSKYMRGINDASDMVCIREAINDYLKSRGVHRRFVIKLKDRDNWSLFFE